MAQWFKFHLVLLEPPSRAALNALNEELHEEDYDAPEITRDGYNGTWRSPLISEEDLQKLFQKHGIKCRFQFWEQHTPEPLDYTPPEPWLYPSNLDEVKEKIRGLSADERDSLLAWLNGEG